MRRIPAHGRGPASAPGTTEAVVAPGTAAAGGPPENDEQHAIPESHEDAR